MDIQEYIASGILEAYALDNLTLDEKHQVETMLSQYDELRSELHLIEEGLEKLAMATAIKPPEGIKENLLLSLNLESEKSVVSQNELSEDEVRMEPKRTSPWVYVAAASVAVALVTSFMAYDFYERWQKTWRAYEDIANSNEVLALQNQQVNRLITEMEANYAVLVNPDFKHVSMESVVEGQNFSASIYWNQQTEEVYLNINQLEKLAKTHQYQLWAIVDGKPIDIGLFNGTEKSLTKMKSVGEVATFAVTIEPKGGSVNPTLEQMQVAGNVS